jgi:hypothetical protein
VAEEFRVPTSIGTHAKLYVVNSIFLTILIKHDYAMLYLEGTKFE